MHIGLPVNSYSLFSRQKFIWPPLTASRYPTGNCFPVDGIAASKTFPRAFNGADTTKGKSKRRRGVFTIERAPLSRRGVFQFSFHATFSSRIPSLRIFHSFLSFSLTPFLSPCLFLAGKKKMLREILRLVGRAHTSILQYIRRYYVHRRANFRTLFFGTTGIYREESCHDKGVNDFRIFQLSNARQLRTVITSERVFRARPVAHRRRPRFEMGPLKARRSRETEKGGQGGRKREKILIRETSRNPHTRSRRLREIVQVRSVFPRRI